MILGDWICQCAGVQCQRATHNATATGASSTYLQGNWAGSASYADNPSARATFGSVKGADEVIYMRENF